MNIQKFFMGRAVGMIVVLVVLVIAFLVYKTGFESKQTKITNYKDAEYVIEGEKIKLENGISEVEAAPGSASKTVTKYFGNDLKIDLNNDGREDVVFLLTQNTGGSGTFFYVVAAINTKDGYVGSDGYLLGDRIAPQNIEVSLGKQHRNVIVVNYADRAQGEPMTTMPSIGKSAYLKLGTQDVRWGVVVPDFEGESS